MKKVILAIVAALAITSASENVVTSGDNLLSVGFHIDGMFDGDIIPGVAVAWDHGVSFAQSFTFGAQTSIGIYEGGMWLTPAFRAGYHPFAMPALDGKVAIAPVFDPYLMMGIGSSIWLGDGNNGFDLDFRAALGCHWMFSEKVGLWGEFGNYFVLGATFKL